MVGPLEETRESSGDRGLPGWVLFLWPWAVTLRGSACFFFFWVLWAKLIWFCCSHVFVNSLWGPGLGEVQGHRQL